MLSAGSLLALRNAAAVAALPPTVFAAGNMANPQPSEQQPPHHPLQALATAVCSDNRSVANQSALQQLGPWSIAAASAFQRTQQAYSHLWPQYRIAAAAAAGNNGESSTQQVTTASSNQRLAKSEQHASAFMPFESTGFNANAASTAAGPVLQQLPGGEGNPHQQLFHAAAAASAAAAYAPYQLAAAAAMASSQMAELQRTLLQQRQAENLMAAVNAAATGTPQGSSKDQQDQPSSTTQDPATPSPRGKGSSASKRRLGNRGKNPYSIDSLLHSHGRQEGEEEVEVEGVPGREEEEHSSAEKKVKLEKVEDDSEEDDQEPSESPLPGDKCPLVSPNRSSSAKKQLIFSSEEHLEKKTPKIDAASV